MSAFTERLSNLRQLNKLSQQAFAKEIGIAFRTYRRYESGETEPTLSSLIAICDYFHVSLDYLAGRTDDPAPPGTQPPLGPSPGLLRGEDQ